jgi:hypothetical protein
VPEGPNTLLAGRGLFRRSGNRYACGLELHAGPVDLSSSEWLPEPYRSIGFRTTCSAVRKGLTLWAGAASLGFFCGLLPSRVMAGRQSRSDPPRWTGLHEGLMNAQPKVHGESKDHTTPSMQMEVHLHWPYPWPSGADRHPVEL